MGELNLLKSVIFRLTAIILGALLAFITVEILARIFYQEPWHNKLEKAQLYSEKYPYTKNEDGLRDVNYPVKKSSNHRRILVLGDSYTFGLGVPNEKDTFSEILETKLNEEMTISGVKRIEVLNGGIPGSLPHKWLRIYRKIEAKFDPDIVLIVFFLRDGTPLKVHTVFINQILKEITIKNRHSFFYQYFFTYRFIKDLLDRSKISTRYTDILSNAYLGNKEQTKWWHLTQEHLLSIKSLAYKNSAEVGFVIFPVLVELNKNYPFMEISTHLEEFALSNGLHLHNLLPAFLGNYGPNLWVSSYDQHPNEKAHQIAAESLLPFTIELLASHEMRNNDHDSNQRMNDN